MRLWFAGFAGAVLALVYVASQGMLLMQERVSRTGAVVDLMGVVTGVRDPQVFWPGIVGVIVSGVLVVVIIELAVRRLSRRESAAAIGAFVVVSLAIVVYSWMTWSMFVPTEPLSQEPTVTSWLRSVSQSSLIYALPVLVGVSALMRTVPRRRAHAAQDSAP